MAAAAPLLRVAEQFEGGQFHVRDAPVPAQLRLQPLPLKSCGALLLAQVQQLIGRPGVLREIAELLDGLIGGGSAAAGGGGSCCCCFCSSRRLAASNYFLFIRAVKGGRIIGGTGGPARLSGPGRVGVGGGGFDLGMLEHDGVGRQVGRLLPGGQPLVDVGASGLAVEPMLNSTSQRTMAGGCSRNTNAPSTAPPSKNSRTFFAGTRPGRHSPTTIRPLAGRGVGVFGVAPGQRGRRPSRLGSRQPTRIGAARHPPPPSRRSRHTPIWNSGGRTNSTARPCAGPPRKLAPRNEFLHFEYLPVVVESTLPAAVGTMVGVTPLKIVCHWPASVQKKLMTFPAATLIAAFAPRALICSVVVPPAFGKICSEWAPALMQPSETPGAEAEASPRRRCWPQS